MNDYTIGHYLRNKRTEKNATLRVVSEKTKINQRLLKDLEANNFSKLPNLIYLKGFINSLAKVLDIDQDFAHKLLEDDYRSYRAQNEHFISPSANTKVGKYANDLEAVFSLFSYLLNWKHLLGFISAGVVVFLFIFVSSSFNPQTLNEKKPFKDVVPAKLFSRANVQEQATPAPAVVEEIAKKLLIKAVDDESWLSYQVDQGPEVSLMLVKNKLLVLEGHKFRFKIGRPEAVEVYYQDKKLDLKTYITAKGTASVYLDDEILNSDPS